MSIRRLEDFAEIGSDWFWETDTTLRFSYLSESAKRFLGRDVSELIGLGREAIAKNADDAAFWHFYAGEVQAHRPFRDFTYPYNHPDGVTRWLRVSGRPILSRSGRFVGYRGVGCDVTAEHGTQKALSEQIRRFDAALENMTQGLCMFDADSRLVVVNHRYHEIFNLAPHALKPGLTHREIVEKLVQSHCYCSGTSIDELCEGTRLALQAEHPAPGYRELADGRIIAASFRSMAGGGWVATFEDFTERRRNEARIAHMARHDALTDLPNRTTLSDVGANLIRKGSGAKLALLCLDLDRFKPVNDSHGHRIGDALLRAVAERLRSNVRHNDLVARLGGDEFAVLHHVVDESSAMSLAKRLITVVSAPYDLDGYTVEIGMSVGIAMKGETCDDIDNLLRNADTALYHAKGDGRGQACVFELPMDDSARLRRELERDLREAVSESAFELHYQPLVDLGNETIIGLEALLRWNHPERGSISPAVFIPVAEETGLIVQIGEWVLNRACRDAASWPSDISIAVNVSAVQLRQRNFAQTVFQALAANGLKPDRLDLEITESVLLGDTEANLQTLHGLRKAGISISLDDFGTGYSSLSYLRRFPFDKIKIDRSFVRDAGLAADAAAIIRALVSLGTSLGITTLVEGIETEEQLAIVRSEGVQQAQGFLFSRPCPANQITEMLIRPASALRAA